MAEDPLVSFVVVAYNQERFISEAVRSAFAQTYHPLEIILSDDCSPDLTFAIMEEAAAAYDGPHRVLLNRSPRNDGLASNLNRCWELSSGEFVVVQAGDDIAVPERTAELVARWRDPNAPVDLVCSHFAEIDEVGERTGVVRWDVLFIPDVSNSVLKWRCGATGACSGYSRRLHEKYGPLDKRVLSEDWVYSFRAWLERGAGVVAKPLLLHRTHNACLSVTHGRLLYTDPDAAVRKSRRRRVAENRLAIAEEWLRAWRIGGRRTDANNVEAELLRLVRLRQLDMLAFDANRVRSLRLAWAMLREGFGVAVAGRLAVRHGLQWY